MRVLLVTHNIVRGDGQGRVNYELARHLARWGHSVTLLAARVSPELVDTPGITWEYLPIRSNLTDLVGGLLWIPGCTNFVRTHASRFDIVHLNGALGFVDHHVNTSHYVHAAFGRYLRQEPPVGLRGQYYRLLTLVNTVLEKPVYQRARCVVAVSPRTGRELVEQVHLPKQQVQVICNGVDPDEFFPDPESRARVRRELAIPADRMALLYVGEYAVPRKGLATVLEALAGLPKNIHLYIAGRGSTAPYATLLAPVEARVHFLGFRRDVADLFRAADAFVYPSRYDTFSLVLLEALASGLPVVTTLASGFGELMTSGQHGFVINDPYDVGAVRKAILRLHDEPDLAMTIAQAGRALAEQYSWEAMARRYLALYEQISIAAQPSAQTCGM
jgi:glycosyltransferase involved in cell wall biosynthesis